MMCVIVLSIMGFTLATLPDNLIWVDTWTDIATDEVIPGSVKEDTFEGAYLSDSPRLTCDKVDEARSPYYEIEVFCITIFTIEYGVRLIASPAGPGVFKYIIGPANVIDLVSILPFYVE